MPCEERAVSESRVQVVRATRICQKCYIDEYRRFIRLGDNRAGGLVDVERIGVSFPPD